MESIPPMENLPARRPSSLEPSRGPRRPGFIALAVAIVVALILVLVVFLRYYVDWLWFGEVALRTVFWKRISISVVVGPVFALIFFAIIYGNIAIACRLAPKYRPIPGIDHSEV